VHVAGEGAGVGRGGLGIQRKNRGGPRSVTASEGGLKHQLPNHKPPPTTTHTESCCAEKGRQMVS
jgi:hypothetical protein